MKTALLIMFVVVVWAVVVILALPVFIGPALGRFGFAESWVVVAIFNSFLLFWFSVLFTGLALAVVIVVVWRVLKVRSATRKGEVESRDQHHGA